jgi:hypothetical protein
MYSELKHNLLAIHYPHSTPGYMGCSILQKGILGVLHAPAYEGAKYAWRGGGGGADNLVGGPCPFWQVGSVYQIQLICV